jgi:hypothetical protein
MESRVVADDSAVHPDGFRDNAVIRIIAIMLAIEMAFLLAALTVLD